MRSPGKSWPMVVSALLICVVLAGCSSSTTPSDSTGSTGSTGSSASTPTSGASGGTSHTGATATPTPPPPPHALAWFQQDSHHVGQIWASVNGGTPHQVTHMPASTADCRYDEYWSPPVFSPDLSKIVAAWGSADCTDGPENGPVYIINASTGAATKVASANIRLSLRQTGWIDNSTIWWIQGTHLNSHVIGGGSSAIGTLSGSYVEDVVLRGSTLFYTTGVGSGYQLARFSLTSHSVLSGAINLGTHNPCACSRGDALTPGFDVSADGAHVVYQKIAPASSSSADEEGVASSQFFYANADGSGARRIASVATAASMVKMQLSPDGRLVAVARAEPAPSVFTASVASAGLSGDPNMHFYTPDGRSYPVWKTDSATFWASTKDIADVDTTAPGNVEHFSMGTGAGSIGIAGGANPWYTIGS